MQRSIILSLSLGDVAAQALANSPLFPAAAQNAGNVEDLGGVMNISLKFVDKSTVDSKRADVAVTDAVIPALPFQTFTASIT